MFNTQKPDIILQVFGTQMQ